jgi:DNA-binding transcriptional LysR family regulator
MDRLRAYEMFAAVAAKGSFTRAADALDTSPANVTRYVQELETHLGVRLINRTSRRLSLTEGGQALYERVRTILDDAAEAEAVASATTLSPRGRLRINAPLSFGFQRLAALWPQFLALYPDIELEVDLVDRVVDLVEEGYDMAIRISRRGSGAMVGRKLAASRNIVCAAPDYIARRGMPMTPADLGVHACVGYTLAADSDVWNLEDDHGGKHAARINAVMRSNNGDTCRAAALAGLGVIWQPTFLVGEDLREGRLVPVLPGFSMPGIDIMAVYPSRRHLSAKVRVMIDFLAETFRGVPPWDEGVSGELEA